MTAPAHRRIRNFYIATVVGTGVVTVGWSLRQLAIESPGVEWFLLAALTLLSGSFTVKLPSLPAKISVSDTFVFTSALLFGPAAGAVTVVLDALVISLWMNRDQRSAVRVAFNATAPAIAIFVASETFFLLAGVGPGQINKGDVSRMIVPASAFALVHFVVNTGLVAGALATESTLSPYRIWLTNFPPVSITYFVGSSIAMLIVAYTDRIDLTVLSIIVPLLVVSHLTFRSSMGRISDAEKHVAQVNEMYLSTIETLAMAVDAKDQITHGHIRRVQVYATELARRLGVADSQQLRAIEAAALLHDMGKLAMPEHILNKPGKLTTAEFETMKRHADIGADLLSSIRFPYPVVPIVRHHHENWNGTGYPAGISGPDIPLGARILSVVDCFDALTSDRPYRPRLTAEDAFAILRERRGVMYDPLVVDLFITAYPEIAPAATQAGLLASSLMDSLDPSVRADPASLRDIRATSAQTSTLADLDQQLKDCRTTEEVFELANRFVRTLTPSAVSAFFQYSVETDKLRCVDAAGDPMNVLRGLTIRTGGQITGWVAANERIIANSDASLDLGELANSFSPRLRSTISGPLLHRGRIIGVLTGYATRDEAFTESHRYAFEQLVSLVTDRAGSVLQTAPSGSLVKFRASERR